jgi:hypothetical protein
LAHDAETDETYALAHVDSLAYSNGMSWPDVNYDEARVPLYSLPDPLILADGALVSDPATWYERRRPELLEAFERMMYGRAVPDSVLLFDRYSEQAAFGRLAIQRQVRLSFAPATNDPIEILIYLPARRSGPVPLFVGLNFGGNHAIALDPGITLSSAWMAEGEGVIEHRATEASRGSYRSRWPVELILKRGYGLATAYYGDIDPDYDDGFRNGVHGLFEDPARRKPDSWGSIAAWSFGLSRILDYLVTDPDVDSARVAVIGHSRLGKAALWAGARDHRFAAVFSNESGCGGAALSRRCFGETLRHINTAFPHWFCDTFKSFNDRERELPIDQHQLIALIAPRPVYIASASEDLWADPRGEFLAAKAASPVYRLLGTDGFAGDEFPEPGAPTIMSTIGYHLRPGEHELTEYDWLRFLDFADSRGLRAH